MSGEELKVILLRNKVPQSKIAKQLGISQQSFNQMLSALDIKTSLLERIANVLNVPISLLYGEDNKQSAVASGNGSVAVTGNNNVANNVNEEVLKERVVLLERLLEEKERTIQILMKK